MKLEFKSRMSLFPLNQKLLININAKNNIIENATLFFLTLFNTCFFLFEKINLKEKIPIIMDDILGEIGKKNAKRINK